MTLPIVEADIPRDVLIKCPITDPSWKYIRAEKCKDCPHYSGLGALTWADDEDEIKHLQWSERYAIRCSAPIEYRTVLVDL
jgi:hypothetical protein